MKLDIAKFQPVGAAPATQPVAGSGQNASSITAKIQMESVPSGADIQVDGSFVGNTPSEVQVSEGDHTVTVSKSGFKNWERKLKVSAGSSIHINAELEKVENP